MNNVIKITTVILLIVNVSFSAEKMEEIVVKATRLNTPLSIMSSSTYIISNDDIKNSGAVFLSDILKTVPGMYVSMSGGPGQATQIYMRGAKPQHTLILLDGVRLNGQLDLNGYDISNLDISNVKQIEIIKSPHSALYGSDAMAGIINIITRDNFDDNKTFFNTEVGSYETTRTTLGTNGKKGSLNYSTIFNHYSSAGFSALNDNVEKDGFDNTTIGLYLKNNFSSGNYLKINALYSEAATDYDDFYYRSSHNDFNYEKEKVVLSGIYESKWLDGIIINQLSGSFFQLNRYEFFGSVANYDAKTYTAEFNNIININPKNKLIVGYSVNEDNYSFSEYGSSTDGKLHNSALYLSYQKITDNSFNINLSVRGDDHSKFNGAGTYQAGLSKMFLSNQIKLLGSIGTGFKAPSSYQLVYNDSLDPEYSKVYEIGIEKYFNQQKGSISLTYFNNKYDDLIGWNPLIGSFGNYDNILKARSKGAEIEFKNYINNRHLFSINYTYLDNDSDERAFEIRRPWHNIQSSLNIKASDRLNLNFLAGYTGKRLDTNIVLNDYYLFHVNASYLISDRQELYIRVENIFDEDYFYIHEFNTPKQSYYIGFKTTY